MTAGGAARRVGAVRKVGALRRWLRRSWPARWWARQSLRARLTLLSTALFTFAVATGAVLLLVLQRYALTRVLDSSAQRTASDIAHQIEEHPSLRNLPPTSGGISSVQVVNAADRVIAWTPSADHVTPVLNPAQLQQARGGQRFDIANQAGTGRLRVLAKPAGAKTVLVATDLSRVDDSQRILTRAALIGSPFAVLLMGLATYVVVALTLRSVAALRHGAADITAAGLADQRLPVPDARDEIHRLAVTLNAMLDRIDSATARQRTFVGDAAHELRSPLASLRVQLEVAQRLGPETDWNAIVDDVMVDVDRLDRLVSDLLALARMDEARELRREPVQLDELVDRVVSGYAHARVPVTVTEASDPSRRIELQGDPDGLHRVIVNLVDNAVRYARSEVRVELRRGRLAGRPIVRLIVTDDGPGIAPAERERVFDRFYRIEESRARESGGTGLGLPIVRDLVRAHGGSVRLTERPGGQPGLQALVVLPLETAGPPT
jgi:signal transduction histidine kinase